MKKILLFISVLVSTVIFTHAQKTGNLTVFSEDGDRFYLILNGEKQSDKPQTNIRVEELPQPYYSAKIIFADSSMATITKNLQISDADNKMMDVTYRIRKDKSGKAKLNPYSAIEVQPDFVAPEGMYVCRYGRKGGARDVSQTTTTVTTVNAVDASVNVPGVSMNVTINDPAMTSTTSTTTTTHSSHNSNTNHNSNTTHNNNSNSDNNCRGWAMKQADFTAAKKTIADASFEATKLSTAKTIASANCLSCDQVVAICNLFSFEDSKLEFAKFAFKYTIDPKNYFKVNNVFSFDASKDELSKFTSGE